jgi:hypothetical protein
VAWSLEAMSASYREEMQRRLHIRILLSQWIDASAESEAHGGKAATAMSSQHDISTGPFLAS